MTFPKGRFYEFWVAPQRFKQAFRPRPKGGFHFSKPFITDGCRFPSLVHTEHGP